MGGIKKQEIQNPEKWEQGEMRNEINLRAQHCWSEAGGQRIAAKIAPIKI